MIEQVEGIHAELCFHTLRHREVLHDRRIRPETTRPDEAVHPIVAQISDTGVGEGAACRCGNVGNRREVLYVRMAARRMLQRTRTQVQGASPLVRATNTHILLGIAVFEARRPRQPAAPIRCTRNLPAADNQVFSPARISGKALALAEWQLIHRACDPDVVTDLIGRPPRNGVADVVVVRVVPVSAGKSVMG